MVKLFSSALFPPPHSRRNTTWRTNNALDSCHSYHKPIMNTTVHQLHSSSQDIGVCIPESYLLSVCYCWALAFSLWNLSQASAYSSCRVIFNLDHILIIFSDAVRQQAERSKKKLDQKNKFLKMFGQQDNYLKYFLEIICLPWAQFETEINQKFLRSGLIGSEWIKRTNNRGVYNERAWEYGWGEDTQSDSFGTSWLT